jgi:hypothetical protein
MSGSRSLANCFIPQVTKVTSTNYISKTLHVSNQKKTFTASVQYSNEQL